MGQFALLFLFVAAILALALSQPQPDFPGEFTCNFTSDWKKTTGRMVLGLDTRGVPAEFLILEDGTLDHLCRQNHNGTACVQLTAFGTRFQYFPQLSPPDCCRCCSINSTTYPCPGPLSPKWLSNATGNLIYLGIENVKGRPCHKWNAVGLSGDFNYYYQDMRGLVCEIDGYNYLSSRAQRADDQYVFLPATYSTTVDPHEFDLPDACKDARPCGPPTCQ